MKGVNRKKKKKRVNFCAICCKTTLNAVESLYSSMKLK